MKTVNRILLATILSAIPCAAMARPHIDIAVLLDTSGSMSGLIQQAKTQLWAIVNDMARTKKRGQTPRLRVALYEYGKSSLPAREHYLRQCVPLTTDLDRVSEALFELTTNGGEEYCGAAIQAALHLDWTSEPGSYKAIFIAGNEPFSQGPVGFREVCRDTIARGIVVNTIFCGPEDEGIRGLWREGAELADGQFMTMDHQRAAVAVHAPQDEQILALGKKLNETYLGYGPGGEQAKKRTERLDQMASAAAPEAIAERVIAKSSKMYDTSSWDLVDAVGAGKADVAEMEEESLPEPMRELTVEERKAYVDARAKERQAITTELSRLKDERAQYLAEQSQGQDTLQSAVTGAVRQQMRKLQFEVPKDR